MADVRNAERRLLRAVRRAARGELTIQMLGDYVDGLDAARGQTATTGVTDAAEVLAGWDGLDIAARQSFLGRCISRVVVNDDEVELIV